MATIRTTYKYECDLDKGTYEVTLRNPLMQMDALADEFRVTVKRSGEAVNVAGMNAYGYLYIASAQTTIALTGSVSGSTASVVLTSDCYAIPGYASLVIQLLEGDVRHAVLKVNLYIGRTGSNKVIDGNNVLPTLAELLGQIAAMEQATAEARTTITTIKADTAAAIAETMDAAADTRKATQELSEVIAPPIVQNATGEIVAVNDSANRPLVGLTLYGKTTQDGTPTPDAPIPLVSAGDGGNISVKVKGKNLLPNHAQSNTEKGVTFTVNTDGSINANGNAEGDIYAWVSASNGDFNLPVGEYILTGCTHNYDGFYLVDYTYDADGAYIKAFVNSGNPITISVTDASVKHRVQIFIPRGVAISNVVFSPMIRLASTTDATYEPYADGGSVTALTPNGLPGIPVTSGGNYTDSTGQQWICDEVDFAKGMYVKRVKQFNIAFLQSLVFGISAAGVPYADLYFDGGEYTQDSPVYCNCYAQINREIPGSHGTIKRDKYALTVYDNRFTDKKKAEELLTEMGFVAYTFPASAPVETPLSADELTAYAAMTTQYPHTTVYNDAGAGMSVSYVADTKTYIDQRIAALLNN